MTEDYDQIPWNIVIWDAQTLPNPCALTWDSIALKEEDMGKFRWANILSQLPEKGYTQTDNINVLAFIESLSLFGKGSHKQQSYNDEALACIQQLSISLKDSLINNAYVYATAQVPQYLAPTIFDILSAISPDYGIHLLVTSTSFVEHTYDGTRALLMPPTGDAIPLDRYQAIEYAEAYYESLQQRGIKAIAVTKALGKRRKTLIKQIQDILDPLLLQWEFVFNKLEFGDDTSLLIYHRPTLFGWAELRILSIGKTAPYDMQYAVFYHSDKNIPIAEAILPTSIVEDNKSVANYPSWATGLGMTSYDKLHSVYHAVELLLFIKDIERHLPYIVSINTFDDAFNARNKYEVLAKPIVFITGSMALYNLINYKLSGRDDYRQVAQRSFDSLRYDKEEVASIWQDFLKQLDEIEPLPPEEGGLPQR